MDVPKTPDLPHLADAPDSGKGAKTPEPSYTPVGESSSRASSPLDESFQERIPPFDSFFLDFRSNFMTSLNCLFGNLQRFDDELDSVYERKLLYSQNLNEDIEYEEKKIDKLVGLTNSLRDNISSMNDEKI
jgi:hypothetical protein